MAMSPKCRALVAEDVFGDAARERDGGRRDRARQMLGQLQRVAERIERRAENVIGRDVARRSAMRRRLPASASAAGSVAMPSSCGDQPRRIVDARPRAALVGRDEPAADREGRDARARCRCRSARAWSCRRRYRHAARTASRSPRQPHRARAVRRQQAFELVAGGGADEFAGLLGEELVDRARILALDRLAGEDHGAAVDVVALQAGLAIGVVDEMRRALRRRSVPSGRNGVSMIGERQRPGGRPPRSGWRGPAPAAAA